MKYAFPLAFMACNFCLLTSCEELCFDASGEVKTNEQLVVNEYQSIKNLIEGDVVYTQGDTFNVMISADERLFETILVQNVNGNLVLDIDEECLKDVGTFIFNIMTPELTGIDNRGSGNFIATDTVSTNFMAIDNSGSGSVRFDKLMVNGSNIHVSGSGSVTASGAAQCPSLNITCTGLGNAEAGGLVADSVTVTASGSGLVRVEAASYLNVTLSGSGNVYYKGSPVIVSSITGSGQLIDEN